MHYSFLSTKHVIITKDDGKTKVGNHIYLKEIEFRFDYSDENLFMLLTNFPCKVSPQVYLIPDIFKEQTFL